MLSQIGELFRRDITAIAEGSAKISQEPTLLSDTWRQCIRNFYGDNACSHLQDSKSAPQGNLKARALIFIMYLLEHT